MSDLLTADEVEELKAEPLMVHLYDAHRIVALLLRVTPDRLHLWNAAHGNTCPVTRRGPNAICKCGLSAALGE